MKEPMFKIIDNYLTKSYHQEIQELLTGSDFPWFYIQNLSYPGATGTTHFNEYGFNHHFHTYAEDGSGGQRDTSVATLIRPFLLMLKDTVGCNTILRCRADMVTWSPEEFIHPAHIDFPFPNVATVYYVNDTDGDTIIYGQDRLEIKERVSPKANRLVIFDGDILHTGSSPTKHKTRILLNSNFRKK